MPARIGNYQANDAGWATQQPVFVGRDYDFELALAMEGVGAGLAARKRRDGNLETIRLLDSIPTVSPMKLFHAALAGCDRACDGLRRRDVTLYGILYGRQHARLRSVLEFSSETGATCQYLVVGEARAVESFATPETLEAQFDAGLRELVQMLQLPSIGTEPETDGGSTPPRRGRCAVGDRAVVSGQIVGELPNHVILRSDAPTLTSHLACPHSAFSTDATDAESGGQGRRERCGAEGDSR